MVQGSMLVMCLVPDRPVVPGRRAGSCEAAAGPGGECGSEGNDCEPRAAARLGAWTHPQHLHGGSSAVTGLLRWHQCPMWNKHCLWLAACGSSGSMWHLTPTFMAAEPC